MNTYISKEETRKKVERFDLPTLEQMVTVRDNLKQYLETRNEQLQIRKQSHAETLSLSRQLRKALKQALAHLIIYECEGMVCRELEKWGFKVTVRTSTSAPEMVEEMVMGVPDDRIAEPA